MSTIDEQSVDCLADQIFRLGMGAVCMRWYDECTCPRGGHVTLECDSRISQWSFVLANLGEKDLESELTQKIDYRSDEAGNIHSFKRRERELLNPLNVNTYS